MPKYSRQEKLARRARYMSARIRGASVAEARKCRDLPSRYWGDYIENPRKPIGVTAEPKHA